MLDENGVTYRYRDYREQPLTEKEIRAVLKKLRVAPIDMLRKRAGWLVLLFLGQLLSLNVIDLFDEKLAQLAVLMFFMPLIISSGGNSGSQAATLVVRAIALEEVTPGDWWRVLRRELGFGLSVGAVLALLVTGTTVNIVALIGVIMLVGIVVNNAIVLVDLINQLRAQGIERHDAIMQAGEARLRPILMTSLTTALGLLPMALGFGEGSEVRTPMAITGRRKRSIS